MGAAYLLADATDVQHFQDRYIAETILEEDMKIHK